jgi:hypothetical protein
VPFFVVNTGRGRATHVMLSKTSSTPNPLSLGGIAAQLIWFGGNAKSTLCGLAATRYVSVFTPDEASCRECRRHYALAVADEKLKAARTPEQVRTDADRVAAERSSQIGCSIAAILILGILFAVILVATHGLWTQQP